MKYRKKPVVIEAVKVENIIKDARDKFSDLPRWLQMAYVSGNIVLSSEFVSINSLDGIMIAMPNDYIIKGIKGEIYPIKEDIFLMTYERVE
jgi:hypothetical protein